MADGAACRWPPLVSIAMTCAQVKDDISLSSFKIVNQRGREGGGRKRLTSNPPPVTPVAPLSRDFGSHSWMKSSRLFLLRVHICKWLSSAWRVRCLYWRSFMEGRSVEDRRERERRYGLLTVAEVLTLRTRISRLARITDNHVRI